MYNFIIPYRNRKEHLNEFIKRFAVFNIDAHFYIIHQIHPGDFNRGALLNIGFLEASKINPDGLFIFHDVDTYPTYWGSINYETKKGEIRHPIKTDENLGTICCFWKKEFELINGFPNYWGWGIEDCTILHRAQKYNIPIDRNNSVDLNDKNKIYNPIHYRNIKKETETCKKNTELHQKEVEIGISNGLFSIEYTVLSSFELVPRFTIINVDFKINILC